MFPLCLEKSWGNDVESLCSPSSLCGVIILQNWTTFVQIENSALLGLLSMQTFYLKFSSFLITINFFFRLPWSNLGQFYFVLISTASAIFLFLSFCSGFPILWSYHLFPFQASFLFHHFILSNCFLTKG